jgi:type IX secretion system PorP/SprF family membrane protein
MRKLLYTSLLMLASLATRAQNDPLYAQYLNNPLLINPAYSGLNNNFNVSASFRKQWAGFDGAPTTINLNGHTSLLDNRMGVGMIILKDKIGASTNTEVEATYAYRLDLNEKYLSFGLQAGFVNFRSNNGDLKPYDPNDPVFTSNLNTIRPSFGAGAILHSERYFIGLSMPRMLNAKATFDDVTAQLYNRHFYLMAAYMIYLNEHIRLKPSVLLKGVKGASLSADVNFSVNIDEKYTAGIYTRNLNAYGLLLQMKLARGYRFGYAFEVPAGNSVGARFTTHELMVGMNLALLRFHSTAITNF